MKYEGMMKPKIFWKLRRLETGLSGFKLKRVHYGTFGLWIIITPPHSTQPNTPSFPSLLKFSDSSSSLSQKCVGHLPSSPLFHFFSLHTHTPIRPCLPIKLLHFHFALVLLHKSVKLALDRCLEGVLRPWLLLAAARCFPAKGVSFWRWMIVSFVFMWFLHVPTSFLIFPFSFLSFLGQPPRKRCFPATQTAAGGGEVLSLIFELRKPSDHLMTLIFG